MEGTKSLLRSRTFWVNAIAVAAYILAKAGLGGGTVSPETAAFIDAVWPVALAGVNILLRTVTKQPVRLP